MTSFQLVACGARSEMFLELPAEAGVPHDGVPDERAPDASAPDSCDLPSAAPDIAELALGEETSCALLHDGTVRCWGSNKGGTLGVEGVEQSPRPVQVPGVTGARHLACGPEWSGRCCAVLEDERVTCWGNSNPKGADAQGIVPGITGATEVVVGAVETCVLLSEADATCGGTPRYRTEGSVGLAITRTGMCFLARDGSVSCATVGQGRPKGVHGLQHVVQIAAGYTHFCARFENGSRICWGGNEYDQFGPMGSTWTNVEPEAGIVEPSVEGGLELALGGYMSCQRTEAGELFCWGEGDTGQLGRELTKGQDPEAILAPASDPIPTKVPGLACVTKAAASRYHACAVARGGLHCWGRNDHGELGDGTATSRAAPRLVAW